MLSVRCGCSRFPNTEEPSPPEIECISLARHQATYGRPSPIPDANRSGLVIYLSGTGRVAILNTLPFANTYCR